MLLGRERVATPEKNVKWATTPEKNVKWEQSLAATTLEFSSNAEPDPFDSLMLPAMTLSHLKAMRRESEGGVLVLPSKEQDPELRDDEEQDIEVSAQHGDPLDQLRLPERTMEHLKSIRRRGESGCKLTLLSMRQEVEETAHQDADGGNMFFKTSATRKDMRRPSTIMSKVMKLLPQCCPAWSVPDLVKTRLGETEEEEEEEKSSGASTLCRKGHCMKTVTMPKDTRTACNSCKGEIKKGDELAVCWECEYVLCPICLEQASCIIGEWHYGKDSMYRISYEDAEYRFEEQRTGAEGRLRRCQSWWEADIRVGIIRLHANKDGSLSSQFKKTPELEWGNPVIAHQVGTPNSEKPISQ